MSSTPPPREDSNDASQDPVTAERDNLTDCKGNTFWMHVQESMCRNHFITYLVCIYYGALYMDNDTIRGFVSTRIFAGVMVGLVCVAFAITTVCEYWWPKTNQDVRVFSEGDYEPSKDTNAETKQKIRNEIMVLGFIVIVLRSCGLLPDPGNAIVPPPVAMPPQQAFTPTPPPAERSKATLTYWRTAVENLHEIRFQVPSSELPSEHVFAEVLNRLKTLTNQAKVAPRDNVYPQLLSMANRHFFIDDRLFKIKAEIDEWVRLKSTKTANTTSANEATESWQSFIEAIQADPELMDKLAQGPEREFIEDLLAFEQQRLDQFYEIEEMRTVLQQRYPQLKFSLPEIGE